MAAKTKKKAEPKHATREQWLNAAVAELSGLFEALAEPVPPVRVSVGWPGGRGKKATTIGQCWKSTASADGVPQVFISPVLDDAQKVLATLLHELVHAVDDCQNGHKGRFVSLAKKVGLVGPWTATTAGDALAETLKAMTETLGEYPHAALMPSLSGVPKQTTRMLKVECVNESGYMARMTKTWLDQHGAPICPHCNEVMEQEAA